MLRNSEPSGRWPDDAWALNTKSDAAPGMVPVDGNRSVTERLSSAETARRVSDDASVVPQSKRSRNAGGPVQVTVFLAGIGLVAVGKFALTALLAGGGSSAPGQLHAEAPAMRPIMTGASQPLIDVEDVEVTVKRFAFTSGGAFTEAAAQSRSQPEVLLARP